MMKYMFLAALLVAGCAASDPVKADLYFEGLCGGCHQFYLDTLFPTWKQIGSIMDIGLYAYGNAYRTNTSSGSWKFTCQHGPQECEVNMMITCFQSKAKNTAEIMNFVQCVLNSPEPSKAGEKCSSGSSVSWDSVNTCRHSSEGIELEVKVAEATEAVFKNVKEQYVPWVVLDGKHCEFPCDHFEQRICDAYTGPSKPAACEKLCYKN